MTISPWEPQAQTVQQATPTPDIDSWVPMLASVGDLAERIAGTEFVPQSLRGSVPKTAAAILYGREIGLPPMTALGAVHVINGRAGISAEAMRALILSAGHDFRVVSMDESRVVVKARRRGDDEWQQFSYTMSEAVKAGDAKKNPNYQTRPAEMLLARATGRCAKAMFADVVRGLGSVEELETLDAEPPSAVQAPVRVEAVVAEGERRQVGRRQSSKPSAGSVKRQQAAPPVRKRAQLPAPRGAAETAVVVDVLPEQPHVIDEETGEVQPPQPPVDAGAGSDAHRKAVTAALMHWDRLGVADRGERLWYSGVIVGREIQSTNDLSVAEVRSLVQALEKCRDLDQINAQYLDQGGDSE